MGKVTYAVNERVRRILRYVLIALVALLIISPFFIFSTWGSTKIHDWGVEKESPGLLYTSARINCMMGGLSDDRFVTSQEYFEEFIARYPSHSKTGYAYFYLAWSIESQKRVDKQGRRDAAKAAYEAFIYRYPNHPKRPAANRALNRIEVDSGR